MKKMLIAIMLLFLILTACKNSAETDTIAFSEEISLTETENSEIKVTTEKETKDNTSDVLTEDTDVYVDEDGLITQLGIEKINALIKEQTGLYALLSYAGLFDFDSDKIPEVYIVHHNSGQGLMPVDIFTIEGTLIGKFDGYCRDGFCRLSYGDNCVYVHNSYEHSMHLSHDSVQKLTMENGQLKTEYIFSETGSASDAFPLKEFTYYINDRITDEKDYFPEYNQYLFEYFDNTELISREANEVSICAYDTDIFDYDDMAQKVTEIYNSYIKGKNKMTELFGSEPEIYAFDDYDGDGSYEAFTQQYNSSDLYLWNSDELIKAAPAANNAYIDYTRIGSLFIAQPFGNWMSCNILGVKDGKPYTHELSGYGMLIRNNLDLKSNRVNLENGIFILRKSIYDATYPGGSHTFKPYYFTYYDNYKELVGVPVTKDDFADNPKITEVFSTIEENGGKITNAYLRGERYLNINYTIPIMGKDDNGNEIELAKENHYKTYMIQNTVSLIDEGRGVYNASIKD